MAIGQWTHRLFRRAPCETPKVAAQRALSFFKCCVFSRRWDFGETAEGPAACTSLVCQTSERDPAPEARARADGRSCGLACHWRHSSQCPRYSQSAHLLRPLLVRRSVWAVLPSSCQADRQSWAASTAGRASAAKSLWRPPKPPHWPPMPRQSSHRAIRTFATTSIRASSGSFSVRPAPHFQQPLIG
jgi:hypothetical protein